MLVDFLNYASNYLGCVYGISLYMKLMIGNGDRETNVLSFKALKTGLV
jgi:hypothetical protein